ncbi:MULTISPECIES: hypothetical protein [unclassified Streptomyces]|uniref:hypothetical protein n=1 Tax=unclassified Streptomyces TaxID=2593676 RepID=UPI002965EC03|nr:hypothetical protein [Streptomyces sp. SJL17-1]
MATSEARDDAPEAVGKTRFDDIYDRADPRAYFTRLAPLEYEIPHHAQAVFRRTAAQREALADGGAGRPAVLDVCCSYGVNAALLNHDVTLAELYARYTGERARAMSTDELAAWDREFYAARRRPESYPVYGLDVAPRAVAYAHRVGLLDAGFTDDLEHSKPGPELNQALEQVGLITVSGGGSYVTDRTFTALLTGVRRPLWVSAFVLRTVSYAPTAEVLSAHGLHTAGDPTRTWPQRMFTDARERQYALDTLRDRGIDPVGREDKGRFHAVLHESRA